MRRALGRRGQDDEGISAMMDVFLVVLVVTVAIVGTWTFSFSGQTRYTTQLDEYNLRFALVSMERWLGSTIPQASVVDSHGSDTTLEDQKVIELLGLEMVLLRQGTQHDKFVSLEQMLKSQLDGLMLPDHHYAANAVDVTGRGPFFFVSSEPADEIAVYEDCLDGHATYTSSYVYELPEGLGGQTAHLRLVVNLACWLE